MNIYVPIVVSLSFSSFFKFLGLSVATFPADQCDVQD